MREGFKFKKAMLDSCNCLTKSPETECHDELCYYRLLKEKEKQEKIKEEIEEVNELLSEIEDNYVFPEYEYIYDGDHSYNEEYNTPVKTSKMTLDLDFSFLEIAIVTIGILGFLSIIGWFLR